MLFLDWKHIYSVLQREAGEDVKTEVEDEEEIKESQEDDDLKNNEDAGEFIEFHILFVIRLLVIGCGINFLVKYNKIHNVFWGFPNWHLTTVAYVVSWLVPRFVHK